MTANTQIRIHNARGTVVFGREGYVLHDLDTGAAILTDGITAGREVSFSAYILPDGASAAARQAQMEKLSRRVRRIVTDADGFTLTAGDRSILLIAKSAPYFAHEAPLNADEAQFFTVRARAARPGAAYFSATADTQSVARGFTGKLTFPLSLTEQTVFGESISSGSFVVCNEGDVPCGFVAQVTARAGDVSSFVLRRADGVQISAVYPLREGESIVIDTRSGKKTVTVGGVPILSSLGWESEFFTLPPGDTLLDWACTGDGSVVISMRITPLYH